MPSDTSHQDLVASTFPLQRPATLAESARIGARRYRRSRDLPGAVSGLLAGDPQDILPRLVAAERRCEEARRAHSAEYRPGQHVQILSALLAESAAVQAEKSAQETVIKPLNKMPEMARRGLRPQARIAGGLAGVLAQAKASGSEALRRAM